MAKLQGLGGDWVRLPQLAREMIADPDRFFKERNVKTEDYACPHEVHDALDRGRAAADAMAKTCEESTAAKSSLPDAVKQMKSTVEKHFGAGFDVQPVPFGIMFKERLAPTALDAGVLVTATGTCTFCSDSHPDVD